MVVVDTPPVLAVSDALIMGAAGDGVVVIARPFHTTRDTLADAVMHLRRAHNELLGVLLNRVPLSSGWGFTYGAYYRYHNYSNYYGHGRNGSKSGHGRKVQRRPLAHFLGGRD